MVEKHTYPKDDLQNSICILMGGRAAEEIMLNTQTTGAENDIENASYLARKMVCEYAMSEGLDPPLAKRKGKYSLAGSSPSAGITVK